jgi:probable phosphoglycerate mutase
MRIGFLRHGPTDWNAQGRIQGSTDIPLSDAGRAKMAGLRLPFAVARVYASPKLRARQTAEALGLADVRHDDRLVEQHWGRWEGLTRDEIIARDGADCYAKAGAHRGAAFCPPGGESTQSVLDRVAAFLKDAAQGAGDAVAVTHMGVLRAAYTLATGWAMDAPMPPDLDVAKILVLALDKDGAPSLAALNRDFKPLGPEAPPLSAPPWPGRR